MRTLSEERREIIEGAMTRVVTFLQDDLWCCRVTAPLDALSLERRATTADEAERIARRDMAVRLREIRIDSQVRRYQAATRSVGV